MISATCIAPVNIAVIKYWGKRDEKLILPYNDSVSGTLSMDQMNAKTTIAASSTFTKNRFWLNGVESSFESSARLKNCLAAMRELAEKKNPENPLLKLNIHICSANNFPTAAGLASSAAGYACLVYTLATLYGLEKEDLSPIARQGSGSACRSMYGGFVHWIKGEKATGEDSIAVQLCNELYWPEMRILIIVVNDTKKKVSSTEGMATTAQNSELFQHRIRKCVAARIQTIKQCIEQKNFELFAETTMKDSNQFHAVCLDSYPPLVYMNDVSHKIAHLVHRYNKHHDATKIAYTFDAGPNACLYMLEPEVSKFISVLNVAFPSERSGKSSYIRGIPVKYIPVDDEEMVKLTDKYLFEKDLLKYIIHTKVGEGPKKLDDPAMSLLSEDGLPIKVPEKKLLTPRPSKSKVSTTETTAPAAVPTEQKMEVVTEPHK